MADDCQEISKQDSLCLQVTVQGIDQQVLPDVVVYLEPLSGQKLPLSQKSVEINQHHKAFSPYISVSQTKQKIRFTNQDDITHHIYSVAEDNKFSFKIKAGQSNSDIPFNQANEIAMGCNIHDWMSGYLLVVDTPYFAKTSKLGVAEFSQVLKGKYQVVVWHPQMQSKNNRFVVEQYVDKNTLFTVNLTASISELPVQKSDDDFDFLSDY